MSSVLPGSWSSSSSAATVVEPRNKHIDMPLQTRNHDAINRPVPQGLAGVKANESPPLPKGTNRFSDLPYEAKENIPIRRNSQLPVQTARPEPRRRDPEIAVKRTSRIGSWLKRSSTIGNSAPRQRLSISEPVLQSSTSELVATARDLRNVGVSSVNQQRHRASLIHQHNSPVPQTSPAFPTISSYESSKLLPFQDRNPAFDYGESPPPPPRPYSMAPSMPSEFDTTMSIKSVFSAGDEEIRTLQLRVSQLKEADDRRRLEVLDLQRMLDEERTKNRNLERRILELQADQSKLDDPKARIRSIEAQREELRVALTKLKNAKDLEVNFYKSQLSRMSRDESHGSLPRADSNGSLNIREDQHMSLSTQQSSGTLASDDDDHARQSMLRYGITPLLPIARTVGWGHNE